MIAYLKYKSVRLFEMGNHSNREIQPDSFEVLFEE